LFESVLEPGALKGGTPQLCNSTGASFVR
jgi:hypothetical protein